MHDLSISNPFFKVLSRSSLVIQMPHGNAPATLCVHNLKTFKLCSSVFEVKSTKTSSPDWAISLWTRFINGVTIAMTSGLSLLSYNWCLVVESGFSSSYSFSFSASFSNHSTFSTKLFLSKLCIQVIKILPSRCNWSICLYLVVSEFITATFS